MVKGAEPTVPLAEGHLCAYSLCFPGEDVSEPSMTVAVATSPFAWEATSGDPRPVVRHSGGSTSQSPQ